MWRKWAPPGSARAIARFMGRPEEKIRDHADRALILRRELFEVLYLLGIIHIHSLLQKGSSVYHSHFIGDATEA